MNLTELQTELRSMEKRLVELQLEVERMKPRQEVEKKKDYETITRLARVYPLENVELKSAQENIKKQFIRGLAFLLQAEEQEQYSRLLYLCRLSTGIGMDYSAEDILRRGADMDMEAMGTLCLDLSEYKYSFLTEMFILANLSGKCSVALFEILGLIAEIMKYDKEEIRVTAQVAKSVLTGNPDVLCELPAPSGNRWSAKFRSYIPQEWIKKQRQKCAELPIKIGTDEVKADPLYWMYFVPKKLPTVTIIERLQAGAVVKKGQCICRYKVKIPDKQTLKFQTVYNNVVAPCDGIVFFFIEKRKNHKEGERKEEYLLIYVVSWFDAYDDFCGWLKENTVQVSEGGDV